MSLQWNASKVSSEHRYTSEGQLNPTLNALIWSVLAVNLQRITEKNVSEWRFRLAALAIVDASVFVDEAGKPTVPALDELKKFIGMETNVFPDYTRSKWMKKLAMIVSTRAANMTRNEGLISVGS